LGSVSRQHSELYAFDGEHLTALDDLESEKGRGAFLSTAALRRS
jgi:gamma-glutamylcyclotransferase (GGCT)/AIG2-like uncharacterized protein YtfP